MSSLNSVESASSHADKTVLLAQLAHLFPHLDDMDDKLPKADDFSELIRLERAFYESHMLPYWQRLTPAYQQALSLPFGDDTTPLETHIEDWPESFDAQQKTLYQLFCTSKLRQSWRNYCQWTQTQPFPYTDSQRSVLAELERELEAGNAPIKEIPLYQWILRVSCQQVICMPVSAWESMHNHEGRYEPSQIDTATVERLATRIAQVFNAPPLVPLDFLQETPSWSEAIVWNNGQRLLTCRINSHGMHDRLEDEYGRRQENADKLAFPEWRFEGFCGQIRVTLEDGVPWSVAVLAPSHFIRHMMTYEKWLNHA